MFPASKSQHSCVLTGSHGVAARLPSIELFGDSGAEATTRFLKTIGCFIDLEIGHVGAEHMSQDSKIQCPVALIFSDVRDIPLWPTGLGEHE